MFTGLIEEVGKVVTLEERGQSRRLTIVAPRLGRELKKGGSIAVSGVCLTAVALKNGRFSADLALETLRRTSLGRLAPGTAVNLELPMKHGERMGGHIVQGHVDGVGELVELKKNPHADDYTFKVRVPHELMKYVVFKGSIALEGISLTVAAIEGDVATVAIIPHTHEATNLHALRPGDPINIEVDVLAKYAAQMLHSKQSGITLERLLAEGF
jgi:riboflavin synthase